MLDDIANCLVDGPLREEVITLVGRTDSRDDEQNNQRLGETRATAARNYLAQRGVSADRIRLISRGEIAARTEGAALDRRVDIEFGDLESSPILRGAMLQSEQSRAHTPAESAPASYVDRAQGTLSPADSASAPATESSAARPSNEQGSDASPAEHETRK